MQRAISILHSKRRGIYYLEKCRILLRDERVEYVTADKDNHSSFWNIPTANSIVILIGIGSSITNAAARKLADDGVMIAFTGSSGTPLFMGSLSEYRPTEYFQGWISNWMNPEKRLWMGKEMASSRCNFIDRSWSRFGELPEQVTPKDATQKYRAEIKVATSSDKITSAEANCANRLYAKLANAYKVDFKREHGAKDLGDLFNSYLDHGNYLAYGFAASTLWTLGISYSFPVSHGLRTRGALVFDVADLIKDGVIMPNAFISANLGESQQEFRKRCIREIFRTKAMDFMFDTVKGLCI